MKLTSLAALVASAGLAFTASQAQATVFTLDSITVTAYGANGEATNLGLGVTIESLIPSGGLTFDLGATDPQYFDLFKIYTTEQDVGGDDLIPRAISVAFNFSAPTPNEIDPIGGVTGGVFIPGFLWWPSQHSGYVDFSGNLFDGVNSGSTGFTWGQLNDGLMAVTINGGTFNYGTGGTTPGAGNALTVRAKFDWDRDATVVPEPATWALMIGGFGLAGAALRRRALAAI